ncbi:hypothetical protein ABBQ32_011202 [Trebouxia sp. C0010 RCD-2024]
MIALWITPHHHQQMTGQPCAISTVYKTLDHLSDGGAHVQVLFSYFAGQPLDACQGLRQLQMHDQHARPYVVFLEDQSPYLPVHQRCQAQAHQLRFDVLRALQPWYQIGLGTLVHLML